tara:strand:- start:660 stop:857 length:198 start_codon:yes stop_codon:yes gene_type:complete
MRKKVKKMKILITALFTIGLFLGGFVAVGQSNAVSKGVDTIKEQKKCEKQSSKACRNFKFVNCPL